MMQKNEGVVGNHPPLGSPKVKTIRHCHAKCEDHALRGDALRLTIIACMSSPLPWIFSLRGPLPSSCDAVYKLRPIMCYGSRS